jgi:small neutral amino acid transporter SnatA (MarC family)
VLRGTNWLTRHLGPVALYVVRKFFGVIAFAISIQIILTNFFSCMHGA